jgi:prophage regulatory protein
MQQSTATSDRILRLKQVCDITGLGRSSVYARISEGIFPKQFPLGGRACGFLASEIEAWVHQVAASRNLGDGQVQ